MWKCNNCECTFEEPMTFYTTYETFYGIGDMFASSTPLELLVCPHCGDEDIQEAEEEIED